MQLDWNIVNSSRDQIIRLMRLKTNDSIGMHDDAFLVSIGLIDMRVREMCRREDGWLFISKMWHIQSS